MIFCCCFNNQHFDVIHFDTDSFETYLLSLEIIVGVSFCSSGDGCSKQLCHHRCDVCLCE